MTDDPASSRSVTFICGGKLVPSSRYRVHPIDHALKTKDWKTKTVHGFGRADHLITNIWLRKGYRTVARLIRSIRTICLKPLPGPILVQRLAIPNWSLPERCLARRHGGLIFDFDDAVFLGSTGDVSPSRLRALIEVCKSADHVVAGNSWLAEQVSDYCDVTVIPTCIDTTTYSPCIERPERDRLTVGWIGTYSNLKHLSKVVPSIHRLRERGYDFEVAICSDVRDEALLEQLNANFIRWTPEAELTFLQSLDIGLMPLSDDAWCKGKCSFKMIQYLSVGCPVIASRVGMNIDVLDDGKGGALVGEDEWDTVLAQFLDDPAYLEQAGHDARVKAVTRYDIENAVASYLAVFAKAFSSSR